MDFKELIQLWQTADANLDQRIAINRQLIKEVSVNKIKSYLNEYKWEGIIEIVFNLLFLFFLVGFVADHLGQWQFIIPGLFLLQLMLFGIFFGIYKLWLFHKIDVQESLLETQRRVERLRYYNILETNLLLVVIPLFSAAFLIVLAKAFLGMDLYQFSSWLGWHLAGSFIVGLIIVFFLRRFPGRKFKAVTSFLEELEELEKE